MVRRLPLPEEGKLLAMSPHMHLRGKAIRVDQHTDSGSETILDVPNYDFNWQHTYVLKNPIPLDTIRKLTFQAVYDNSQGNPHNPDATAFVTWGDQTWEEMAIVFYEIAVPRDRATTQAVGIDARSRSSAIRKSVDDGPRPTVQRLFDDLDRDRDGRIEYEEVDQAVQLRSFHWYDLDQDRIIEREEAIQAMARMGR